VPGNLREVQDSKLSTNIGKGRSGHLEATTQYTNQFENVAYAGIGYF